jgi:hypothetical protein
LQPLLQLEICWRILCRVIAGIPIDRSIGVFICPFLRERLCNEEFKMWSYILRDVQQLLQGPFFGTFPILTIAACKGVKLFWDGLLVDHEMTQIIKFTM